MILFALTPQSEKGDQKQEDQKAREPVSQLRSMAVEAYAITMYMRNFLCVENFFHGLFLYNSTFSFSGEAAV